MQPDAALPKIASATVQNTLDDKPSIEKSDRDFWARSLGRDNSTPAGISSGVVNVSASDGGEASSRSFASASSGGVGRVYRIAGGVSDPVPIFKPKPEYSEEARKAKLQGAVLLSIVIDSKGHTRDVRVLRGIGLGLDEKAIEAVLKWKFRPSKKDGHPVSVTANVEVSFKLL